MSHFYAVHVRTVLHITCGPQTVAASSTVVSRYVTKRREKENENHPLWKFYNSRDNAWNLCLAGKNILSRNKHEVIRCRRIISGGSGRLRRTFGPPFSESLRSNLGVPDNSETESLFVWSSFFAEVIGTTSSALPVCENEHRVTHRLRSTST